MEIYWFKAFLECRKLSKDYVHPPKDLGFDGHAESEGEEDVEKHDGHDSDGQPNHEVLVALDLVCNGGVAALEVVINALAVGIIGIGLSTVLNKDNEK